MIWAFGSQSQIGAKKSQVSGKQNHSKGGKGLCLKHPSQWRNTSLLLADSLKTVGIPMLILLCRSAHIGLRRPLSWFLPFDAFQWCADPIRSGIRFIGSDRWWPIMKFYRLCKSVYIGLAADLYLSTDFISADHPILFLFRLKSADCKIFADIHRLFRFSKIFVYGYILSFETLIIFISS